MEWEGRRGGEVVPGARTRRLISKSVLQFGHLLQHAILPISTGSPATRYPSHRMGDGLTGDYRGNRAFVLGRHCGGPEDAPDLGNCNDPSYALLSWLLGFSLHIADCLIHFLLEFAVGGCVVGSCGSPLGLGGRHSAA